MPRKNAKKDCGCCCSKQKEFIIWGIVLILLGFALKISISIAELLIVLGVVFAVKGLLLRYASKKPEKR